MPNAGGEEIPSDVSAVDLQNFVDHLNSMEVDETLVEQTEGRENLRPTGAVMIRR